MFEKAGRDFNAGREVECRTLPRDFGDHEGELADLGEAQAGGEGVAVGLAEQTHDAPDDDCLADDDGEDDVLVRSTNSLALAFQGSLLFCVVGVIGASVLWPDPSVLIGGTIEQFVEIFRASGATEDQLANIRGWDTLFFGLLAAAVFSQLAAALLLGYWWNSFGKSGGQFGLQFRMLKLGRVLGIPATLLMAGSLVLDLPLIQNLFPLALLGFWFQGLAVGHAWARAKRWHPAVLGTAYVLLITPLTGVVILIIGSMGLVDNWINLRAPLHRLT